MRHPGAVLILAHGAICDQGVLTTRLADHPGVLYDISCFFPLDVIELFARVPRASGSCSPPIRPTACPRPPSTWPCGWRSRPASTRPASARCWGARWRACSTATAAAHERAATRGLDHPLRTPRAGVRLREPGRPGPVRGAVERARAMLDMAIAACRDPQPGEVGEALETIGTALGAASGLLADEDGMRPAIDLVYRAIVLAATEIPDGPPERRPGRRSATRRRPTRLAAPCGGSRSRTGRRAGEGIRATSNSATSSPRSSSPPMISSAGAARSEPRRARAAGRGAGWRARTGAVAADPRASPSAGQRRDAGRSARPRYRPR